MAIDLQQQLTFAPLLAEQVRIEAATDEKPSCFSAARVCSKSLRGKASGWGEVRGPDRSQALQATADEFAQGTLPIRGGAGSAREHRQ